MSQDTNDAARDLQQFAELLAREAPPVADVPFTLTAPPAPRARPAAAVLPFGDDDDA